MLRLLPLFLLASLSLAAQTDMTGVKLEGATTLHLSANFSQVEIRQAVSDEITIEHSVVIEGERRPELAKLSVGREGQTIKVKETSPTQNDLKSTWERGDRKDCCKSQINMIVRVPAGIAVTVETIYGSVDVEALPGLREVDATYGGVTVVVPPGQPLSDLKLYSNYGTVDLSLPPGAGADLELETEHGELLTDLEITINGDASKRRDFFERVVGTVGGGGALVQMRAPYGKVYLRGGS